MIHAFAQTKASSAITNDVAIGSGEGGVNGSKIEA